MQNYDTSYEEYQLARAYVPFQTLDKVYSPKHALCYGTLFPELNMPYKHNKHKTHKRR